MQEYIKMNDMVIRQPDEGLAYSFETTYSEDTTRVQSGALRESAMFTVEAFTYSASNLSLTEMRDILQIVAKGKRFKLHYFSPYHGQWRDDYFYVGKGSLSIGRLNLYDELFESLSFQMTGVNPIK